MTLAMLLLVLAFMGGAWACFLWGGAYPFPTPQPANAVHIFSITIKTEPKTIT